MSDREKPAKLKNEHLEYLDALREPGRTNMFGAPAYLQRRFKELKSFDDASAVVGYWMHTFRERHEL